MTDASGRLYFGQGFRWHQQHTQQIESLIFHDGYVPTATDSQGGCPAFAAVGAREARPVWLDDSRLEGHVGVVSTTGSGKTSLFKMLILGSIPQRGPTIVIDPKFDRPDDLCLPTALAAYRAGKRFVLIMPAFYRHSAHMNVLDTAEEAPEVVARIQALLPGGGGSVGEPFFNEFALGLIQRIATAQQRLRQPWTLEGVYRAALYPQALRQLLSDYLGALGFAGPLRDATQAYQASGLQDLVADGLINDQRRDPDHFQRISTSLDPAFRGVIGQPYGDLFSDLTTDVTWTNIVREEMVVYIGLSSLILQEMANRIGRIILQDLVGYLGRRSTREPIASAATIRVFIDEFGDIMYPLFTNALNKGRSPKARFFLAMQSLADPESASSPVEAKRVLDNLGTQIWMRQASAETAEIVSRGFGLCRVMLPDTRVGQGMGGQGGLSANASRGLTPESASLLDLTWFTQLPKGHAFMRLDGEPWYLQVPYVTPFTRRDMLGLDASLLGMSTVLQLPQGKESAHV
jgi:conjugal transfer pilus assembly protein TraD